MDAVSWSGDPLRSAVSWYLMSWNRPSILVSLMAGMLLIWCFKDKKYALAAIVTGVILYFQGYLDYGWRGVALMLLFYAFLAQPGAAVLWCWFMLWWALLGGAYQSGRCALNPGSRAALRPSTFHQGTNLKLPKWFFSCFSR
jgi:hypothetical protein